LISIDRGYPFGLQPSIGFSRVTNSLTMLKIG